MAGMSCQQRAAARLGHVADEESAPAVSRRLSDSCSMNWVSSGWPRCASPSSARNRHAHQGDLFEKAQPHRDCHCSRVADGGACLNSVVVRERGAVSPQPSRGPNRRLSAGSPPPHLSGAHLLRRWLLRLRPRLSQSLPLVLPPGAMGSTRPPTAPRIASCPGGGEPLRLQRPFWSRRRGRCAGDRFTRPFQSSDQSSCVPRSPWWQEIRSSRRAF